MTDTSTSNPTPKIRPNPTSPTIYPDTPSIQWFPGHMHKARKEAMEIMPQMDVVIEVIDARIPFSSENPMISDMVVSKQHKKPVIKILNKADLADPHWTKEWAEYYGSQDSVSVIVLETDKTNIRQKLIDACKQAVPNKASNERQIYAMILGIPNVGKSTLINALAGRVVAKTGNEPAVTKTQQRIRLDEGILLYDTPGMLWGKIENPHSGYRLASTGGVKDTAFDVSDVASYTAEYLLTAYPDLLKSRYKLDTLPKTDWEFMQMAGKARGFLQAGGRVDAYRMADVLINELRDGTLGRITLETPDMKTSEDKLVNELRAKAEAKKQARIEAKKERKLRARRNRK